MSYINGIFTRLDIQHIREFLLYGEEAINVNTKDYKERIDEYQKPAIEMIMQKFPNEDECEKITNKIYDFVTVTQDVYMEIGMQCGTILMMQLLGAGKDNK